MVTINNNPINAEIEGRWYETDSSTVLRALVRYKRVFLMCEEAEMMSVVLDAWKCMVKLNVDYTERPHPLVASNRNSLNHTIPVYELSIKETNRILRSGNHWDIGWR
jgi:hypothetical protein